MRKRRACGQNLWRSVRKERCQPSGSIAAQRVNRHDTFALGRFVGPQVRRFQVPRPRIAGRRQHRAAAVPSSETRVCEWSVRMQNPAHCRGQAMGGVSSARGSPTLAVGSSQVRIPLPGERAVHVHAVGPPLRLGAPAAVHPVEGVRAVPGEDIPVIHPAVVAAGEDGGAPPVLYRPGLA